jgi:AcrR family transcriptional regulator
MKKNDEGKPRLTGDVARKMIVAAAARVIAVNGIGGLRVRQVADEAGMHHASMLHHYSSREEIMVAVAQSIVDRFRTATWTIVEQHNPAEEAVLTHVNHILSEMESDPAKFIVLTEIFAESKRNESLQRLLSPFEREWVDAIVKMLMLGQSCKTSNLATRTAEAIVALVKGLGLSCTLDRACVTNATRTLVKSFLEESKRK